MRARLLRKKSSIEKAMYKRLIDPDTHPILFHTYHTLWMAATVAAVYYFHLYSLPALLAVAIWASTK